MQFGRVSRCFVTMFTLFEQEKRYDCYPLRPFVLLVLRYGMVCYKSKFKGSSLMTPLFGKSAKARIGFELVMIVNQNIVIYLLS